MDCADHRNSEFAHCPQCLALYWKTQYEIIAATPRPVPTCERLPTAADADCMGCVWAFGLDLWQYEQVQFVDPLHHSHWQPTGLVRPAEPDGGDHAD